MRLQLGFLYSMWAITPLHLSFSGFFFFFVFLFFHLDIFPGLEGPKMLKPTWLVWLSFPCCWGLSMLCGHISRGKRALFLSLPPELVPNSLWKASLWNFSAFCPCYQTFDTLSKQSCLPFSLQGIPGAHIPIWIWTAWL